MNMSKTISGRDVVFDVTLGSLRAQQQALNARVKPTWDHLVINGWIKTLNCNSIGFVKDGVIVFFSAGDPYIQTRLGLELPYVKYGVRVPGRTITLDVWDDIECTINQLWTHINAAVAQVKALATSCSPT